MKNKEVYRGIIDKIFSGELKNDKDLTKVKLWACKKYGLDKFPRNSEILSFQVFIL
jgi:histone acetyltransferase (RNA polymerase elongator complex component)